MIPRILLNQLFLIDEIDKADLDFPNDLLWELEKKEFYIKEVRDEGRNTEKVSITGDLSPLIIITSNDERELPDAFLRRCLFYYIEFPSGEMLEEIIVKKLKGLSLYHNEISKKKGELIDKFSQIRTRLNDNSGNTKPPSTSEFLDWIQIVAFYITQPEWELKKDMSLSHKDGIFIRPEDILVKKEDDKIRLSQK